jgi:serine/threonine protein kinase
MGIPRQQNAEPIPGYRLLEFLGHGGFGEVWKCTAPGGLFKAIKFVHGTSEALTAGDNGMAQEWQAVQRVLGIRHPFLVSIDRVDVVQGDLVIVMELADQTLQALHLQHQAEGSPGIPRPQLLGYLCEAAEALDVLNFQHGLQHLDVKPGNLFLIGGHVKLADFGLVEDWRQGSDGTAAAEPPRGLSPPYAAPERFAGQVSASSDQFSLALVYQELLTSRLPFRGNNYRQLLLAHTSAPPDLKPLPEGDRVAVARALAKKPEERFPSCLAFVRALVEAQGSSVHQMGANPSATLRLRRLCETPTHRGHQPSEQAEAMEVTRQPPAESASDTWQNGAVSRFLETQGGRPPDRVAGLTVRPAPRSTQIMALPRQLPPRGENASAAPAQAVAKLIQRLKEGWRVCRLGKSRYLLRPGEMILYRCRALLPEGMARLKSACFAERWNARAVHLEDDKQFTYHVALSRTQWPIWFKRPPGLVIDIRLGRASAAPELPATVIVRIRPAGLDRAQSVQALQDLGPVLLESFESCFQPYPDRRLEERLRHEQPVTCTALSADRRTLKPVTGQVRDVSLGGMRLWLPEMLAASELLLSLSVPTQPAPLEIPARVTRVTPCGGGACEVGVQFGVRDLVD